MCIRDRERTAADTGSEGFLTRHPILHSCKGGMEAMKKTELKELYKMMFPEYPEDVYKRQSLPSAIFRRYAESESPHILAARSIFLFSFSVTRMLIAIGLCLIKILLSFWGYRGSSPFRQLPPVLGALKACLLYTSRCV